MHWLESAAVLLITWIRLEPKIQVNTGEQRCWTSSRTEAALTDPNPSVHFLLTQHILICFLVLNVFYRPWLFWWFSRWKLSNMTKSFFFFFIHHRVAALEAACTSMASDLRPLTRSQSDISHEAVPLTITKLTEKLRDREDEIFELWPVSAV